jgi:predicted transcriptional regulator
MRQLGDLERAVMDTVWRNNRPVTGREVVDELNTERRLAYTTVLTIMDRLVAKGVLRRHRAGRAFTYEAVQSREAYTASLMNEVLGSSEDPRAVLLHFVQQMPSQLRKALKRAGEADQDRKQ